MSEEKTEKDTIDPKTGMPDISAEEKLKAQSCKGKAMPFIFPLINMTVGTGIAFSIYTWGDKAGYDQKISVVNFYDLQWGFLSAFVFAYLV